MENIEEDKCVGVIVPIYNTESYLMHCLDSLLCQTHSNFIAVLINDGSTDKSLDIAKKYCMKDRRFILIDGKINQGVSRARNLGIDFFQKKTILDSLDKYRYRIFGDQNYEVFSTLSHQELLDIYIDYLCFLDSDDYLDKRAFDTLLNCATRYCLDLVCVGINRIDFEYKMVSCDYGIMEDVSKKIIINGLDLIYLSKKDYFHCVCAICINFNFFNKLKIRFVNDIVYEDHCFGTELFINAQRIMVIQDFLYNQVSSANSITRPKNITYDRLLLEYKSWRDTIDNLEKLYCKKKCRKIIKEHIQQFYYPNLIQSFGKLTCQDKKERMLEFETYKKYLTLKTLVMLNFPKLFNFLKKTRRYFLEK